MNSDIIPQGPSEILDSGAIVTRDTLAVYNCDGTAAIEDVVFDFPAGPANTAATANCVIPAGGIFNLKSFTVGIGPVYVIYRK